jgi:hypothetical protein
MCVDVHRSLKYITHDDIGYLEEEIVNVMPCSVLLQVGGSSGLSGRYYRRDALLNSPSTSQDCERRKFAGTTAILPMDFRNLSFACSNHKEGFGAFS